MELVLIRHARPDIAPGICYGRLDLTLAAPITPAPERIVAPLAARPPERIVASPAARARDTAAQLAMRLPAQVPCHLEPRLRELDFGSWEGQPWDAIARADLDDWAANLMTARPHGGESAAQVMARVTDWAKDLDTSSKACWWIVTHAGPMRMLAAYFLGLPLSQTLQWELAFGATCQLRIDEAGGAQLGWWNRAAD